ncbi:glycerate kinase type-2 family protein [Paracoccus onubensis]|uniref:DUF4147 domain-containing protein n=1 Tax=Paracoccus onubensis TaxID=1675788 RepID=A0A418T276_9RHOB|nr:DUF4147 domain-containing protein [Paracoccus onubensis]RJE87298.1 DUF4147 domain-containing protein [Paracoccus onubensis]
MLADMRALARQLFDRAIAAANPADAVDRHFIHHPPAGLPAGGHSYVIAIGKAAPAMLDAALRHISGPVTALGVTHHQNVQTVPGARIFTAGHPEPDEDGLRAGREIIALLQQAGPRDQVIALISGGGSALVPAPKPPLTLKDKQAVNRLLLENGLDITEMNLIRQQLSDLKGGGFLRYAAPAPVTALILSDVIGNELSAIASGPTTKPLGDRAQALTLLKDRGLLEALPAAARNLLEMSEPSAPRLTADNHLIGSNEKSLEAMRTALGDDWATRIVTDRLIGDVENAATRILQAAEAAGSSGPTALIFGGETTVHLRGTGRGGRNQELALRIAMQGDRLPAGWTFLSGGTDGRDGPTDAAGGIVDGGTVSRIRSSGKDAGALLANNDSHAALKAAGDLLITGATGTNVADVQLMLIPDLKSSM